MEVNEQKNSSSSAVRIVSSILFSLASVTLALVHAWHPHLDTTTIVLLLIAPAPWLLEVFGVRHIEVFGTKIDLLRERVRRESQRVDDLYLLSMGQKVAEHLRKFNRPNGYGEFFVGSALPRELEFLENLGYIEFKPPLKGLDDFLAKFNGRGDKNLSDYVALAENGKLFIERFSKAEKKRET